MNESGSAAICPGCSRPVDECQAEDVDEAFPCLDPEVCNWPEGRCVEPSRCEAPRGAVSDLRLVGIPAKHLPEYVTGASVDPDTLRLAAEAHSGNQALSGEFTVKPWVVLYLLDVWEAAREAAEYHASQGVKHIVDVRLKRAVDGD